jgi:hypothetical protein
VCHARRGLDSCDDMKSAEVRAAEGFCDRRELGGRFEFRDHHSSKRLV